MSTTIIGVDCATDPRRVGLARARYVDGRATIIDAQRGDADLVDTIVGWIEEADSALLALDSPLGWPAAFGAALHDHAAGESIPVDADSMFRRMTDDVAAEILGRRPLDVASNLIARTAHATLNRLEEIRTRTGLPIPLAWNPELVERVEAIEVYPAVTLKVLCAPTGGYKTPGQRDVREAILARLSEVSEWAIDNGEARSNADVLDAAVCVVAGADFLAGQAFPPPDLERARKEGWIWAGVPGPE